MAAPIAVVGGGGGGGGGSGESRKGKGLTHPPPKKNAHALNTHIRARARDRVFRPPLIHRPTPTTYRGSSPRCPRRGPAPCPRVGRGTPGPPAGCPRPMIYIYIHYFALVVLYGGLVTCCGGRVDGGMHGRMDVYIYVCVFFCCLFTCTSKSPSRQPARPHSPVDPVGGCLRSCTYLYHHNGNTRKKNQRHDDHESTGLRPHTHIIMPPHVSINPGLRTVRGPPLAEPDPEGGPLAGLRAGHALF